MGSVRAGCSVALYLHINPPLLNPIPPREREIYFFKKASNLFFQKIRIEGETLKFLQIIRRDSLMLEKSGF
jgi:hypothetical protein